MGQQVTKAQTTDMILDYVDRLKKITGIDLSKENIVIKLDIPSLERIMNTKPDEVYAFFGLEPIEGGGERMTVILMPRKEGNYIKETGSNENLALESWDPISTIPNANNINSTTLNTILS